MNPCGPGSSAYAYGDKHEHSETKQTPLARYTAGLEHVRPADPEAVRLAFLWREKHKVYRDATISLQGNTCTGAASAGVATRSTRPWSGVRSNCGLIHSAEGVSRMEIYLEGNSLGTATLTLQKRQRHLKVERLATEPPDPPKPKSSLDFLAALREEYRAPKANNSVNSDSCTSHTLLQTGHRHLKAIRPTRIHRQTRSPRRPKCFNPQGAFGSSSMASPARLSPGLPQAGTSIPTADLAEGEHRRSQGTCRSPDLLGARTRLWSAHRRVRFWQIHCCAGFHR